MDMAGAITCAKRGKMDEPRLRVRVLMRGAVQGVGFRPFVYRLASDLGLDGWVKNSGIGLVAEVEGRRPALEEFLVRVERERPKRAYLASMEPVFLDAAGYSGFSIEKSDDKTEGTCVMPDIATCPECRREICDPSDRRYGYPFNNCTLCGPRYSVIETMPYDRPGTTMKKFEMCDDCRKEYEDPGNRRFHAQPIACPVCGPSIRLLDRTGTCVATKHEAMEKAVLHIKDGKILAVKGLGGFHLMVDATDDHAVRRLREYKKRDMKPFALMYPDITAVKQDCNVSALEERLLMSPEAPIVLLEKRPKAGVSAHIAPGNPYLGIMLPYTPLHIILTVALGVPIVATSGNISEEPICATEEEALRDLGGIADAFLTHDRPIARRIDDSIVRVVSGQEQVLRRARGYAPLPVGIENNDRKIIALGAHLKNTIAITGGREVFISQHIGDLSNEKAIMSFSACVKDMRELYGVEPEVVARDMHKAYVSSMYDIGRDHVPVEVQHHHAHILSCMADNSIEGPVTGVAWDGTGYGPDGTIWGGEFLRVDGASFERSGHFRLFPLPGGEKAIVEPRRAAIGAFYAVSGAAAFGDERLRGLLGFAEAEYSNILIMLERKINSPLTSSAGRVFDAVSALTGICHRSAFEGHAAMSLEFAMRGDMRPPCYGIDINRSGEVYHVGLSFLKEVLDDVLNGKPASYIAKRFHDTMVEIIVSMAGKCGNEKVVLSGGCFQNRYLTERTVNRLREEGFKPYWHQRVPPNDGGISLGQLLAASRADIGRTDK
ncbi:MAG: carbamoyltransferase HypF [Candidatus Omnitrophica bacterium]|nr:carbamoyltransferase HypF [Candidatus Omnitrophota bacterium]MDD5487719.1 carbamoyltransferase HypF [Candidatus Omnitrophota bacterium]